MKRIVLALISVMLGAVSLFAQNYDYKPRESWPYLLEEFMPGVVCTPGGKDLAEGYYNICLTDGKLHYVADGKIMEAEMMQVQIARIFNSIYINRLGRMMLVVSEEPGGNFLLLDTAVDMDQLEKTSIGYGVNSATASTQKVNNLGLSGSTVSMELQAAIAEAKEGPVLPLEQHYYFLLGARQVEATKSNFLSLPGIDKADAKAFLKKEKIKWRHPDSLVKVLGYIVKNQ